MFSPLPFDVGWPAVVVDLGCPLEERGQIVDFLVGQFEIGHLPATGYVGGHSVHPGIHVCLEDFAISRATTVKYVGKFRCKVRTFTHEGVAADAVVVFPDVFASYNLFGKLIPVIPFGHCPRLGVKSQNQKQKDEECTSSQIYVSGHAFGKAFGHWSLSLVVVEYLTALLGYKDVLAMLLMIINHG